MKYTSKNLIKYGIKWFFDVKIIEGISSWIFKWFFDVKIIEGISSWIYLSLFFMFLNFAYIGLIESLFKTYFEVLVVFAFMLIFIYKGDKIISNSNNGFFSVVLWIECILFVYGWLIKDYGLFIESHRFLIIFSVFYVIYLILKALKKIKELK